MGQTGHPTKWRVQCGNMSNMVQYGSTWFNFDTKVPKICGSMDPLWPIPVVAPTCFNGFPCGLWAFKAAGLRASCMGFWADGKEPNQLHDAVHRQLLSNLAQLAEDKLTEAYWGDFLRIFWEMGMQRQNESMFPLFAVPPPPSCHPQRCVWSWEQIYTGNQADYDVWCLHSHARLRVRWCGIT